MLTCAEAEIRRGKVSDHRRAKKSTLKDERLARLAIFSDWGDIVYQHRSS